MKTFIVVILSLFILSCETTSFVNIGHIKSSSFHNDLTFKLLSSEDDYFIVYQINQDLISIYYSNNKINSYSFTVDTVELNIEQIERLKSFVKKIIDVYDSPISEDGKLLDFFIIKDKPEFQINSVASSSVSVRSNVYEGNEILFRMQYFKSKDEPNNEIKYDLRNNIGNIPIEKLKGFYSTLEKFRR